MASLAIRVSVSVCPFWVEVFHSRWEFSALAPPVAAATLVPCAQVGGVPVFLHQTLYG